MTRKSKGVIKTRAGRESKAGQKIYNKIRDKVNGRTKKKGK
jgi:hypothetical protein